MQKETFNPQELFSSREYGFSQIIATQGGKTVYFSGQVAWDTNQEIVGPNDFRQQVWQALENVKIAVQAAGGTLADIVSMRIYIVADKLSESKAVSDGLHAFFPGDNPPTTTWIGVQALANAGFLIEIEPIAVINIVDNQQKKEKKNDEI